MLLKTHASVAVLTRTHATEPWIENLKGRRVRANRERNMNEGWGLFAEETILSYYYWFEGCLSIESIQWAWMATRNWWIEAKLSGNSGTKSGHFSRKMTCFHRNTKCGKYDKSFREDKWNEMEWNCVRNSDQYKASVTSATMINISSLLIKSNEIAKLTPHASLPPSSS